jgi:hypothetical protein
LHFICPNTMAFQLTTSQKDILLGILLRNCKIN